jgi:hypothetical protein
MKQGKGGEGNKGGRKGGKREKKGDFLLPGCKDMLYKQKIEFS